MKKRNIVLLLAVACIGLVGLDIEGDAAERKLVTVHYRTVNVNPESTINIFWSRYDYSFENVDLTLLDLDNNEPTRLTFTKPTSIVSNINDPLPNVQKSDFNTIQFYTESSDYLLYINKKLPTLRIVPHASISKASNQFDSIVDGKIHNFSYDLADDNGRIDGTDNYRAYNNFIDPLDGKNIRPVQLDFSSSEVYWVTINSYFQGF